ncbi:hypothetical protein [Mycobacterium sp. pW045]|uniref:hypothetical protein n=1 Tax=Mycobacterium sp. pW045 TaxID=3238984 RepID=UPI00351B3AFF
MRYLLAALAVSGLGLGVPVVAWAQSPPPCAAYDTCQYMPNPYYDGPLLPTWNVPGTYGGWTTLPVMCDPVTYSCQTYVPGMR